MYGVSALLGVALAFGATSCSKSSDPTTEPVTPVVVPEIEVNNTISGLVTDMSGEGISGASVTLGDQEIKTGADGSYAFSKVAVGTHSVDVEATGKISTTGVIEIGEKDNGNHVLNFTLQNEAVKMQKNEDGTSSAETETETLKGNDAAKIEVAVEAPADIFDEEDADAEIEILPTYSSEDGDFDEDEDEDEETKAFTRAGNELYLIGSKISCSKKNVKLKKSLSLTYSVDPEMLLEVTAKKKVKGGQWTDVKSTFVDMENGKITIEVDEFASYGLFCTGTMTSVASTEPITFTQDTWDNTQGNSTMQVANAVYTYKLGTEVEAQKDKVLAYLVEMIVRATGAGLKEMTGNQPINLTLPAGGAMSISGVQNVDTFTASLGSKSVSAKKYGNVVITTKTWAVLREHTGGGSK